LGKHAYTLVAEENTVESTKHDTKLSSA